MKTIVAMFMYTENAHIKKVNNYFKMKRKFIVLVELSECFLHQNNDKSNMTLTCA